MHHNRCGRRLDEDRENKDGENKDGENIERQMGSKSEGGFHASSRGIVYEECDHNRQSPSFEERLAQGAGSGMRMLTYFINRSGRGLSAKRGADLEKAKSLLSKKIRERSKPQA
jgi:hypothetical protein